MNADETDQRSYTGTAEKLNTGPVRQLLEWKHLHAGPVFSFSAVQCKSAVSVPSVFKPYRENRPKSVLIALLGAQLIAILKLTSASIVLVAFTVPEPPELLTAAHVIVSVAASVRVRVLAGFLRLTHWHTSRVGDMIGRCCRDAAHTSA